MLIQSEEQAIKLANSLMREHNKANQFCKDRAAARRAKQKAKMTALSLNLTQHQAPTRRERKALVNSDEQIIHHVI
jgi:hypothetical protein